MKKRLKKSKIKFTYEGKEFELPGGWHQMTLQHFVNLNRVQWKHSVLPVMEEFLTIQILEALTLQPAGTFDDITMGELNQLTKPLNKILEEAEEFNKKDFKTGNNWIEFEGRIWGYYKDPNDYRVGEVADINTLMLDKKAEYEYINDIAAIIIRPMEWKETEQGTKILKSIKQSKEDWEANKPIIAKMDLEFVTRGVNFFLSGLNPSNKITKSYLKIKKDKIQ